jgi:uncharacterized protein (TIGR00725 family)
MEGTSGVNVRTRALVVGVFGSASEASDVLASSASNFGALLAEKGIVVLTGACPGLSMAAIRGCKGRGGGTIGVSPAADEAEHRERYKLPTDGFDTLIYTGAGLKGRNVVAVRSSDVCVVLGGGFGTLNEFTIAVDEGKRIGVLAGTGGVADLIPDILGRLIDAQTASASVRAQVRYEADPQRLIDWLTGSGDHGIQDACPGRPAAR